jgi:hypothetical protein
MVGHKSGLSQIFPDLLRESGLIFYQQNSNF